MSSIQYLKFCWAMWVGAIIFMVALMLFLHCFPFVFMFVMLAFCCSSLYVLPFFLSLLSFLFNCVPFCLLFILFSSIFTCAHGCLLTNMFKVLNYQCSCEYKCFSQFWLFQICALLIMFILVNYCVVNVGVPIHDLFSFHHVHTYVPQWMNL